MGLLLECFQVLTVFALQGIAFFSFLYLWLRSGIIYDDSKAR